MATVTPMMQQYLSAKERNPDAILFFRLGDFYEMFFEDAKLVSRELELTLTGKDCGLTERAPMCGVPFHAADGYIRRLVEKGYKVAICEQMEDPKLAKGLVARDIIRVVTPGTLTVEGAVAEKRNNFLASVCIQGKKAAVAYCDVTTGEFYIALAPDAARELRAILTRVAPGEVITNDGGALYSIASLRAEERPQTDFGYAGAKEKLLSHFGGTLTSLGLDGLGREAVCAAGGLMRYLDDTQRNALSHISSVRVVARAKTMPLDPATRRNLELTQTLRGKSERGSLLSLLDLTVTAMGGRLLRAWVEQPLTDLDEILARQSAVNALYSDSLLSETLRQSLSKVYDMERLLSRVSYHTLSARDCLALLRSLEAVPEIKAALQNREETRAVTDKLDEDCELRALLFAAIDENAPIQMQDGGMIKEGYNAHLDELRRAGTEGKQWLSQLEEREREETGIKNLRVQYNRVFGYYIEITKSNLGLVPLRYQRRQTLAAAERYTTDELRELESKVVGAQEQALKLEVELFNDLRERVALHMTRLQATAEGLKTLDALLSLARAALEYHYVRPSFNDTGALSVKNGRHPVVERMLDNERFVPNDTEMDMDDRRMQIITGPNMAGKSTYMRQVALIVLMAHMGSFVPADSADIPLTDCVYTRVGASDDLAGGQSTFMVEMSELAYILRCATARSLVILDEIGRGTSTFDGLSIAWATVEYLCDRKKSGAKTLFATHYHELSELEGQLEGVENRCVAVKEMGDEVVFLRTIIKGGADKSFGAYVARLAGVPNAVVARAQEIQARLLANDIDQNTIGRNILEKGRKGKSRQVDVFSSGMTELIQALSEMDVLSMTPMQALSELFVLREKARKL